VLALARDEDPARSSPSSSPRSTRARSTKQRTCSSRCSSLRYRRAASGRITGPGGEQAALGTLRKLPRGRVRGDSAREVSDALRAFAGKQLDAVEDRRRRPGTFTLSIEAEGLETSIRLDPNGARIQSVAA